MSRKTRVILALCVISIGIVLAVTAFWFSLRWLFYENPRLILRVVQLECREGYWAGKTEQERNAKAQEFARRFGLVPGKTNLFSVNLRDLRESIRRDQPEIERVAVKRVLPDLLVFEIQNRIPRAEAGSGFLLDDQGVALRRDTYYAKNGRTGLPLVHSDTLLGELTSEGKTTDPEITYALEFIHKTVTSKDPLCREISVRKIIVIRNSHAKYLQCEISYKDEKNLFSVKLSPPGFSDKSKREEQLDRVFAQLIPWLERGKEREIDLRNKGMAVVPR